MDITALDSAMQAYKETVFWGEPQYTIVNR